MGAKSDRDRKRSKPSGWNIRQKGDGQVFTVYFWHGGVFYERSTRSREKSEAREAAARIYAGIVSTVPVARGQHRQRGPTAAEGRLLDLVSEWQETHLASLLDPSTVDCYGQYATSHWVPHFGALNSMVEAACVEYRNKRLRKVLAKTVRKELSALRNFLNWCFEVKGVLARPVQVPGVPKRTLGTKYEKRRRSKAIELSPAETQALLAALPQWSERTSRKEGHEGERFAIRARFVAQYETSLRSELWDLVSVPEHYRKGRAYLEITPELDKARIARRVPLTKRAREALDSVCPTSGLIFGTHDYRYAVAKAARAALTEDRAKLFTACHLRSARITHWLEHSRNLAGVQSMAGHLHVGTTAGYVRPSQRAAEALIQESEETETNERRAAG